MRAVARLCTLPRAIELLLVVLLPKPEGGTRPIGLFPTLVRIFVRYLRPIHACKWEREHSRGYWYGQKRNRCEMAIWKQACLSEYCTYVGMVAASAMLDLHKAFEKVRHCILWSKCASHNFPLHILKFLLMLYSLPAWS